MRRLRGFTLIEMMVVVAIVGVLAMAARPVLALSVRRTQELELRRSLRALREAIDAYKRAADDKRIVVSADATGYPPSLEVLVEGAPDAKDPKEHRVYFLRRLPRDPFAAADVPAARTWGLRASDSPAAAPRPGRDIIDVYSRSTGEGLDGTPLREW
jgi:general secretion pathway protein G